MEKKKTFKLLLWHSMIHPTEHLYRVLKNKINHKKRKQTRGEITFEKLRELQSETVAIATLYQ